MSNETKFNCAKAFLEQTGGVFIELDPSRFDVRVPEQFRAQKRLTLQFGERLTVPIPDLRIDKYSISGTLAFAGKGVHCYVTWDAVSSVFDALGFGEYFSDIDSLPKIIPNKRAAERGWIVFEGGRK